MKPTQKTQSNPVLGDCASGALHSSPGKDLSIHSGARAKTKHSSERSGINAPQGKFIVYSQLVIASFIGLMFIAHSLSLPQLPYSILGIQLFLCFISFHPHLAKDVAGFTSRLFRH
ncbi:MAG TPA: hypothetical protein VJU77_15380 [Chthoniobacterales bacterium]|nr:hypothetical protein [Chthoniobacterales bacterium]